MADKNTNHRPRCRTLVAVALKQLLMSLLMLAVLFPARPAHALHLEMHRFDRRFVTDFVMVRDGQAIGEVRRHRWCQLWRRSYSYAVDNNGPICTAQQTFNTLGHWYPWAASFTFLNKYDEPIAYMDGRSWTWLTALFDLKDVAGRPLASVRVDDHAQLITISPPGGRLPVWGTFTRVQQASLGRDRWDLWINEQELDLPEEVWPPLAAFFAESFSYFGRSWVDG